MVLRQVLLLSALIGHQAFGVVGVAQERFPEKVEAKLDEAFTKMFKAPHVVNSVALVDAKNGDLSWSSARGWADRKGGTPMTPEHLIRTASVTKSFTGVLVMQLIENGTFTLDTSIGELLDPESLPRGRSVNDLHVFSGETHGDRLTVRHLLNHTSGLADYWFNDGMAGDWSGKSWLDVFEAKAFREIPNTFDPPTRLWTPKEILQFYYEIGLNRRAHFEPGDGFLYSDTNYLLLGMIIERASQKSLADTYRKRIYDRLGLKRTYKEYREMIPQTEKRAHHFWFLRDQNLDIFERQLASTGEWANGGQVTSVDDLKTFIRGLFAGELFNDPNTLDQMLNASKINLDEPQKYFDNGESTYNRYTCGLKRWNVESTDVWGRTGFWGVGMFYLPEFDVCIVQASNQVESEPEVDMKRVVAALAESGFFD